MLDNVLCHPVVARGLDGDDSIPSSIVANSLLLGRPMNLLARVGSWAIRGEDGVCSNDAAAASSRQLGRPVTPFLATEPNPSDSLLNVREAMAVLGSSWCHLALPG